MAEVQMDVEETKALALSRLASAMWAIAKSLDDMVVLQKRAVKKVEESSEPIDAGELMTLEVGMRAENGVRRAGIETIGQLCLHTADELMNVRYFGASSLHEVREALKKRGLYLAGEGPHGKRGC